MKSKYHSCIGKKGFVSNHSNYHCYDYLHHKGAVSNKKTAQIFLPKVRFFY